MSNAGLLLDRLRRVTLVLGKGGVGKTTCASGLAFDFAARGDRTLVVTTDPAGTLGELLSPGAKANVTLAPQWVGDRLDGWLPDLAALRDSFLREWRETIGTIIDRGTYLDRGDVDGLVDTALPGADEIFLLLALGDIIAETSVTRYERILVDTAPTGHTLRLLDLPSTFRALVMLFDAMQEKHRFMVRSLTHRYRHDRADDFIDQTRDRLTRLTDALGNSAQTAALLVLRAEPVVAAESARYADALASSSIPVAAIVVNAWTGTSDEIAALKALSFGGAPGQMRHNWFVLPRLETAPADLVEAGDLIEAAAPFPPALESPARVACQAAAIGVRSRNEARALPAALFPRSLTIVGGKGGVGKTTVACALAIAAADAGEHVLLVSTDPAPSIADALGQRIGAGEQSVIGVERLEGRQMDAGEAFARLRDEYRGAIDRVFSAVMSAGLDAAHDRTIVRDLLAFSPPGIDELYALSILGDALEEARFTCVVIDPAPTGHLLRLLDMPAVAVDWSHRLMRLMLKYKDVVGLGDAAESLLAFARRTRGLELRLHDAARAGVIQVALNEPLVRYETARLLGALAARGLHVPALLWNRVIDPPIPLSAFPEIAQFVSENVASSLIGVDALRAWTQTWKVLRS